MRVDEIMSRGVQTVGEGTKAQDAYTRMRDRRIHHLVVLDRDRRVVGLVSERDLGSARGWRLREGRSVAEFMTRDIVSADRTDTIRSVANKMRGRAIGCLPVFDNGKLVGIVTTTDLLDMIGRGAVRDSPKSERRKGNTPRKGDPKPRRRR